MTRPLSVYLAALFSVALAVPAMAHEGAGIVHFMSEPDHVVGLIFAVAVPPIVWLVARRVRSRR